MEESLSYDYPGYRCETMNAQAGSNSQRATAAWTLIKDTKIEPTAIIGTGYVPHHFGFIHSLVVPS